VSLAAWIACALWLAVAALSAAIGARRGVQEGRGARARARLASPTIYLFTAYLLVAAFVTPRSSGETTSPLLWLALLLPIAYALATLTAIGRERRPPLVALALAILHGGAVCAGAAIVLALASPAFVPAWLR
jgi:cytochrome bd-type quinol oxidase subunit 2